MTTRVRSNRVLNTKDFKHAERSMTSRGLLYPFPLVFLFLLRLNLNLNLNLSFRVSSSPQQLSLFNHISRSVGYSPIDSGFHL